MRNRELFRAHFLPIMVELANDKVVNVKLVLAEIVKKHRNEKGVLSEDEEFLMLVERLQKD